MGFFMGLDDSYLRVFFCIAFQAVAIEIVDPLKLVIFHTYVSLPEGKVDILLMLWTYG